MKIAVTGGTGFVGSHSVAALLGAGHEVRLLARNPDRVRPALEPLGVDPARVEIAVADVTDRAATRAALEGVDAALHAASVYSFDPRRAEEIARTNDEGVRNVLELGVELKLDPIVHVSSILALLRADRVEDQLTPDSPPGNSPFPYCAAKARQEEFAQALQAGGAPVVITNPGGVWGPHDPYDGESQQIARAALRGRMLMLPPAMRIPVVDIRDLASVHAALMVPGRGPRRYLAARSVDGRELARLVTRANGRELPVWPAPAPMARAFGALGDFLRSTTGFDLGVNGESIWVGLRGVRVDSSRTESDLGVRLRPTEETVEAQIRWMREAGRL